MKNIYILGLLLVFSAFSCKSKKQTEMTDAIYTIKKGACFGTCPIYILVISTDGTAKLDAERFLQIEGKFEKQLKEKELATLVELFNKADFFSRPAEYQEEIFDLPTSTFSVKTEKNSHTITGNAMPEELDNIGKYADKIARSSGWTTISGKNLEEQ